VEKNPNDLLDKVPLPALRQVLVDAREKLPVGSDWQHYRGEVYRVIGHTVDKNTNELRIIYARPADMDVPFDCLINEWQEPVSTKPGGELGSAAGYTDWYEGPRFKRVEDGS
jgi:hypothetical protein